MTDTPTRASSVGNHSPVPSRPYYVWLVAGGAVDSDGVLIASFASVFFSDLAVAMYVPCTIRAHRGATQHGGPTLQSFTRQLHRAARRKTPQFVVDQFTPTNFHRVC